MDTADTEVVSDRGRVPYGEKTADPIKAGFNRVNLFYTEKEILRTCFLIWDMAQKK